MDQEKIRGCYIPSVPPVTFWLTKCNTELPCASVSKLVFVQKLVWFTWKWMCRENFHMNGFAQRLVMTRYRRASLSPGVTRVRARCSLVLRSIVLGWIVIYRNIFSFGFSSFRVDTFFWLLLVLVVHGLAFIQLLHPITCQRSGDPNYGGFVTQLEASRDSVYRES